MTNMKDIREKSEADLTALVEKARETIREERFKDKFSKKSSVIKNAKTEIARALTELSVRRRNQDAK